MTVTAVVVGSLNTDLVTTIDRIPLVGETRTARGVRRGAGGKGANQAVALARLGAAVSMVGCVGDDADGRTLTAGLSAANIGLGHVRAVAGVPTGMAVVMVEEGGDNAIVVVPGANSSLGEADIIAAASVLAQVDVVLTQLETPLAAVAAALRRAPGALRVLNAAPALPVPDDVLALVDVLIVNESEASELGGRANPAVAATALRRRGAGTVVVTLGAEGSLLSGADGVVRVPAPVAPVVDTTGAGDCFVAALCIALAEHRPAVDALRFANAAGALAVTRPGTQKAMPTRAEIPVWSSSVSI